VSRGCVGGRCRVGFDAPTLHIRDELIRDLSQDILGQPGHTEDMVPCTIHVVSEWDKLARRDKIPYDNFS
jgi:hypothetical protein